jgi:uncharacterized protein DUF4105
MKIFWRLLLIAFFFFAPCISFSQTKDTCHLRISLLTCGPGEELYSTFGHTAIRVVDSAANLDIAFNYGTFDDSDPYFYLKFTRGIMRYALSADTFSDFMQEYISDKRSVTEQILNLDCDEKQHLFNALKENTKEENRYYDYQFYLDNCTSRAREIIKKNAAGPITFKNILPEKTPTFRQLIHDYLESGHHYWDEFGIDLLMGSHLDVPVTNEQAMFLPDYLMKGFDSATKQRRGIVTKKMIVLAEADQKKNSSSFFTPFILLSFVALAIILLSFSKNQQALKILNLFDTIFFFLIGLLGTTMALVWLARVDIVCRNNLNILWAWPTHVVMAFFTKRKKAWAKNYFRAVALIALMLLIGWAWLPQQLNIAFLPLLAIILARSISISRKE